MALRIGDHQYDMDQETRLYLGQLSETHRFIDLLCTYSYPIRPRHVDSRAPCAKNTSAQHVRRAGKDWGHTSHAFPGFQCTRWNKTCRVRHH